MAGYVFTAIILFFLGRVLYTSQSDLAAQRIELHVDWLALALALILQSIGQTLSVETWRRLLIEMDASLSFADAFRIWFYSNLARYVPGNIWQPVTMAFLAENLGVRKTKTLLSQALFIILMLALAGVLGIALLPVADSMRVALFALCIAATLFFILPPVFRFALNVLARVLRVEAMPGHPTFLRGLGLLIAPSLMWLANGLSFFVFLRAIGISGEPSWFMAIAIYASAYLIGYVSFLTPSGFGVRESALAFFLSPYLSTPLAVAAGLLTRLLVIAGELVCVSAAWWITQRNKK
jgi:glycosyltransferase 2 family protein